MLLQARHVLLPLQIWQLVSGQEKHCPFNCVTLFPDPSVLKQFPVPQTFGVEH